MKRNILDVPVDFPYEPYTMQLSMMTRIVGSLNKKQNCLLESPTGTGKTMALLCSSLAWVQNQHKKNAKSDENNDNKNDNKNKPVVPKIFFGTRTHKQIGQVVREMSRSAYHSIPMTILSSRKQSCVNNEVLRKTDINQGCLDACKTKECSFKVKNIPNPSTTWDIESMKVKLKKKLVCPYYQSRLWSSTASIVFCPYNYLLNPSIRKSMAIDLTNAIVILDEGHNIEDICREGASTEITLENLTNYKIQLYSLLRCSDHAKLCSQLLQLIHSLTAFIEDLANKLVFVNEDILKNTWNSREAVAIMLEHNLTLASLGEYKCIIMSLIESIKKEESGEISQNIKEDDSLPKINGAILSSLENSITVIEYMLNEGTDLQSDFRVVVTETGTFTDPTKVDDFTEPEVGVFLSSQRRKRKNQNDLINYTLNILCMHPGLIFKDIAAKTHSIILASGTLSPLSSFQRELSCNFDTSLEAGHVVKLNQTMVASVSCGPRGIKLNSTYKNVETYAFQDELGALLLGCCKAVPHGVLCFVSSFLLIDKLFKRWQATKLVNEIQRHKTIVIEPRNSSEMGQCMKDYYDYLDNGALMLAVYRGKVSEGMDFSNEAARLVIAVGIPYPSFTDFKVNLKKDYNDKKSLASTEKGLFLSGREWYSIQAYRALNQAIGRCIRHKDDWGAMIFVDERFSGDYYNQGLCKWIRARKKHFDSWPEFMFSLDQFIGAHVTKKGDEDI